MDSMDTGDFYVISEECISCGAPAHAAPDLMIDAVWEDGHKFQSCRFIRQPSTVEELDQAIAAVNASCVCAVRYRGTDPAILSRLGIGSVDHSEILPPKTFRPILTVPADGLLRRILRRFL
jgi:hypothetical protein